MHWVRRCLAKVILAELLRLVSRLMCRRRVSFPV